MSTHLRGHRQGRKLTGIISVKDDAVNAGATWLDQEVVEDGNLISSRGLCDLPAFMRAIIKKLA